MKNLLVNYKIWLYLVVLISILIIIGVDLKVFPLIPTEISNELINKINKVMLALSYSILSAYIFFFFSIILPRIILIQRSKKILSRQVHWLLYELFVLINQILFSYEINKPVEQIEEKDLLHLNGNLKTKYKGFYSTSEHWNSLIKKGKQFTGFGDMPFEFPDSITNRLESIPNEVNKIRQSNPNFHVDELFSEILSSIETNKIIEWYGSKKNELFKFANSSSEMYAMIVDYKRLKKLKYHLEFRNIYNKIHFYTREEIDNIKNKQVNLSAKLAPLYEKLNYLNPCIIYNSEYQESRAIISVLRINKLYDYKSNTSKYLHLPDCKCIILIEEKIPRKQLKIFIKENESEKIIIRLKSNMLISTKSDKFKNKETAEGLYTLNYRKPFKLFNLTLFKKFPTILILENINRNIHYIMSNYKIKV